MQKSFVLRDLVAAEAADDFFEALLRVPTHENFPLKPEKEQQTMKNVQPLLLTVAQL